MLSIDGEASSLLGAGVTNINKTQPVPSGAQSPEGKQRSRQSCYRVISSVTEGFIQF